METEQACRHCGKSFEPRPGKLELIDECEDCLQEKIPPQQRTYFDEENQDLRDLAETILETSGFKGTSEARKRSQGPCEQVAVNESPGRKENGIDWFRTIQCSLDRCGLIKRHSPK